MELNDLVQQCKEDSEKWFPSWERDMNYLGLCLGGEIGEFQNILKKIIRGDVKNDEMAFSALATELVDILIYLAIIAGSMNLNLQEVYDAKRQFNDERFTQPPGESEFRVFQPDGDTSS